MPPNNYQLFLSRTVNVASVVHQDRCRCFQSSFQVSLITAHCAPSQDEYLAPLDLIFLKGIHCDIDWLMQFQRSEMSFSPFENKTFSYRDRNLSGNCSQLRCDDNHQGKHVSSWRDHTYHSFAFKLNMHTSIFLVKSSHILHYYGEYVLSLILMYRAYWSFVFTVILSWPWRSCGSYMSWWFCPQWMQPILTKAHKVKLNI